MSRQRQLFLASLLTGGVGMVLACGGITDPKDAGREEARKRILDGWDEARKKIVEADALWDRGEKAKAVSQYKAAYAEALASDKEKVLPRIVEFLIQTGDLNEAKTWVENGLKDEIEVDYPDPVIREFVAEAKPRVKKEEAEKRRKAEAEAARKAEEEYDANGLVLLVKTVKSVRGQFGGEVTGTVINRRPRKLSYAQITFNLYDESGARVGTALANINGLEPGERWNFKATTFGTDFASCKFSELSGF